MFKINIIYWSGIDPCQNTDNVTKLHYVLELVAANNNGIHSPSKMASQREGTDCSRPGQSLDFQVPPVQL